MLKVGLTGGIGCGKTTVTNLFRDHGIPIIDADQITRRLVEPGSDALRAIAARFGEAYLDSNGNLNRRALRQRIFEDPDAKKGLEAILHPRVRDEIQQRLATLDAPYCLVVIPLLIESGMQDLVDRVLVVDCRPEQQTERVVARDGVPPEHVEAIMAAQLAQQQRLAAADDVIDNSGDLRGLEAQISELDARYRQLSANPDL